MKRLIFIIITICVFTLSRAQNVTISAENEPAAAVFRNIVEQTGKNFVYSSELLDGMRVSVNVKNKSLKHTLSAIFKNTDVHWKIKGRNIILSRKAKPEHSPQKEIKPKSVPSLPLPPLPDRLLDEVVVVSRLEAPAVETSEIGAKKLTAREIINTPVLFGESDVIKALHLQPGISEGQEGMAGMNVHGGNSDENLYMLDNIPLYQVNHFAGLFSAFNPEAIRYIDFFKSSIPAKYDGRLSSYLDVRTKNGQHDGHHGTLRLGLISGAFNIDGPVGKSTTYSVALRRSWLDVLSTPMIALINSSSEEDEKIRFRYAFMDLNAKVTHRFSYKATGFISTYFGNDLLKTGGGDKTEPETGSYYDDKYDFDWGNFVAQAGINYRYTPSLTAEFTAGFTRYFSEMKSDCLSKDKFPTFANTACSKSQTKNNINDWIARADLDWRMNDDSHVRFGGNYILHSFLPAHTERSYVTNTTHYSFRDSTRSYTANEANAYIEDDWHAGDRLRINAGLHLSLFNIDGKTDFGFGPRFSASYRLKDNLAFKAAYARTNQYVHQLSQTFMSLPSDQWVPVTRGFKPQNTDKISVGAYWQTADKQFAASAEGYYKVMRNLVDYRDEYYLQPPTAFWTRQLCSGKGTAKGFDFKIEKTFGELTGHVAYSLAWADRTFADKNGGKTFPARFDNRHTINILLNWNVSEKVTLNAAWTGHSGNRFTLLTQMWEAPDFDNRYFNYWGNYHDSAPLKTGINNYQLPFYHRLDLSMMVRNSHGYWTFSLFNAYSHMNTVAIYRSDHNVFTADPSMGWSYNNYPAFKKMKLLPVIPSISYTWQF